MQFTPSLLFYHRVSHCLQTKMPNPSGTDGHQWMGKTKRIFTFCNRASLAVRGTKNTIGHIHHDFADYAFLDEYPGTLRWNLWKKKIKASFVAAGAYHSMQAREGEGDPGLGGRRWSSGRAPCEGSAV